MTDTPLIQAEILREWLATSTPVVLLDARFDLTAPDAGERSHAQGHLPGAHYAHLERDLSGPKTNERGVFLGRHPLPSRAQFAGTLARWGITPHSQVVVYDDHGAMFAARVWWMLRWMGHGAVAVLDGGLAAWTGTGGTLETHVASLTENASPYPDSTPLVGQVDADYLMQQLGRLRIIDARAGERYRGEVEPLDAAAGHIPGARNRFFKDNLDTRGRFKPAAVLRAEWQEVLGGEPPPSAVHQCGSGATACHNLLAMEIAGLPGGRLYPGSWSEWSSDPARPVARG